MSIFGLVWVVKPKDLAVGDIVIYSRQGKSAGYCHRIIGQDEKGNYLIKGDNDPQTDVVTPAKIHYKVDSWKNIF